MLREEFIKIGSKYVETSRLRASDGGEALVLLHEGLGCVKLWGKFPSKLKEKFGLSVFSYSRFGYGRSSGLRCHALWITSGRRR